MFFKNIKGTKLTSFYSVFAKICSWLFHFLYSWGICLFGTNFHFILLFIVLVCLYLEFVFPMSLLVEGILLVFSFYVLAYMLLSIVLLDMSKHRRRKDKLIKESLISVTQAKSLGTVQKHLENLSCALSLLLRAVETDNKIEVNSIKQLWNSYFKDVNSFDECLEIVKKNGSLLKPKDVSTLVSVVNVDVMANIDLVLSEFNLDTSTVWFPKIYTDKHINKIRKIKKSVFGIFKRKKIIVPNSVIAMGTKAYNCAMYDAVMLNLNYSEELVAAINSLKSTWVTTLTHEYLHIFIQDELSTSLLTANLLSESNNVYALLSLVNSLVCGIFSSNLKVSISSMRLKKKFDKSVEDYANYVFYYDFNKIFDNSLICQIDKRIWRYNYN